MVSSEELKGRLDTQLDMELTDRVTVISVEPPVKLTHVVKDMVGCGLHSLRGWFHMIHNALTVIIILCYTIIISVAVALAALLSLSDCLLTNLCAVEIIIVVLSNKLVPSFLPFSDILRDLVITGYLF